MGKSDAVLRGIYKCALMTFIMLLFSCVDKNPQALMLHTSGLTLGFNAEGEISKAIFEKGQVEKALAGHSLLKGCVVTDVRLEKKSDDEIVFLKTVENSTTKQTFQLTETFKATENSIRWEIQIKDDGENWSTPIQTILNYPASENVKFWAPWADPRGDLSGGGTDNKEIANAIIGEGDLDDLMSWADPLEPIDVADGLWHYGAPRYEYENPGLLYCPFQGDVITIPMVSFWEEKDDIGLSLVLSPEDTLLDINVQTTKAGEVTFSRYNHRIGQGKELTFAMDIVPHQADWRSSLGWVVNRYENYFQPVNPLADQIAGTGAYSNSDVSFDVEKMKKMAFRVNWRASFDFPYMGMFAPPVDETAEWSSFVRFRNRGKVARKTTSMPIMQNYAKKMKDAGFYVLSYFNVTEFGTQIEYPRPKSTRTKDTPLWRDANDYLYENLADAILFAPKQQKAVLDKGIYSVKPGDPFFTWEKAIALDPGVESYQNFLVGQAERTVAGIPDSFGICIDRMDWTRFYNHSTDDGVSWMGEQPVGSLFMSWMGIMEKLHPIFHDADKVIYVNNHVKRIEQLKYVDGIFDEFTYSGSALNAIAFLGNQKPTLGWMSTDKQLLPDPDQVIQKFIYMGVFPMAPFPGNDHSMRPSDLADKVYLDYGPLFDQMRGKKWVFEPHVIAITKGEAKVNLFKTDGGYSIPVMYAGEGEAVEVTVRKEDLVKEGLKVVAYYPGDEQPTVLETSVEAGELKIKTPIKRSCAMIKIEI
ncbi:hypothetical protein [Zobellia galactanivorans]|uniref:Hypothetical lipoprotein n=1 Tax=Zobellia galactanivorans (strain DSM 12802 / CCUG 47099 / CIP 106680 / NCIMB 13871 / Dsij) TaxID=63186 RepID=G0L0S3_ZOBGA|nr:hypothetical protein [Zobellia galactanivorans]CAZ94406.1 Hypothetical lipoprotein [Zobellia galactanivorans]